MVWTAAAQHCHAAPFQAMCTTPANSLLVLLRSAETGNSTAQQPRPTVLELRPMASAFQAL